MQIHKAQCAKYRLFQEGYSLTPQMHSYDISSLAGIFYFPFFLFQRLLVIYFGKARINPGNLWWMVTGKDISFLFILLICSFSVHCHLLLAFSQNGCCSSEASSTVAPVQFKVCDLPRVQSSPLTYIIRSTSDMTYNAFQQVYTLKYEHPQVSACLL